MKLKKNFTLRQIAGEILLVPAGGGSLDFNQMLTLNEMGAEIWELLPQVSSPEEIVQHILAEYEAEADTVRADVQEFLSAVQRLGII